jgi:VWFA-related protein
LESSYFRNETAFLLVPSLVVTAGVISVIGAVCLGQAVLAQNANPPRPGFETATEAVTFSTRVDLVMVPVVVRDGKGHAVGNLTKEDFELFDKGIRQTISRFSVEPTGEDAAVDSRAPEAGKGTVSMTTAATAAPVTFIAYYFDDVHTGFGDLAQIRAATVEHMKKALRPGDRAAVYTASGLVEQDFTDDRDKLIAALGRLRTRLNVDDPNPCPPMTPYEAHLIQNVGDWEALAMATADTIGCMHMTLPPIPIEVPREIARAAAGTELTVNDREVRQTLNGLKILVRRMSGAPGRRSIVLMSSGFLQPSLMEPEVTDVMQRAVRGHVAISALNVRGVWSPPAGMSSFRGRMQQQGSIAEEGPMEDIAAATGGVFVHNTNDFGAALERIAAPEFAYLLGFSPTDLKYDGTFHSVKVTLRRKGLELQAMRGYFAPLHFVDAAERAKQEISEALFSRDEMQAFAVTLRIGIAGPRVSTLVHIDIKALPFQKMGGRSSDTLTLVYGLFDQNGKLLHTFKQSVDMKLKPETFDATMAAGLDVKNGFDVQPGKYSLRVVVRDSAGEVMSAQNGAVEIPQK